MNNILSSFKPASQLSQISFHYKLTSVESMFTASTTLPSVYSPTHYNLVLASRLHCSCSCFSHLLIAKSLLGPYFYPLTTPLLPWLLGHDSVYLLFASHPSLPSLCWLFFHVPLNGSDHLSQSRRSS